MATTTHIYSLNDAHYKMVAGNWAGTFSHGNAWFGGGYLTTTERLIFASDTSTAVIRGPFAVKKYYGGAHGNITDGWYHTGGNPSNYTLTCRIDRIIFASDISTAVAKGPLSKSRHNTAAHGNTTDAWFAAGSPGPGSVSTIDRIIFATDSSTALAKGPLSSAVYNPGAHGNTTDGWFSGGIGAPGPPKSTVQRVIFASDTSTAVVKGPLSDGLSYLAAHGNTTDGWYGCGFNSSSAHTSRIDRIIFASDTSTAVTKGPLSVARYGAGAGGNTTDGWYAGGYVGPGPTPAGIKFSSFDRVIFASDTSTVIVRGKLEFGKEGLAAN